MPQKAPRPVGWAPDGAGFGFSLGGGNEASLIQNPHHAQALSRLRRQRLVERVHRLGPCVLFELIDEVDRVHGRGDDLDHRLERYAGPDPVLLAAVGGNRFLARPLRAVGGAR
jgi:hypothetical protein